MDKSEIKITKNDVLKGISGRTYLDDITFDGKDCFPEAFHEYNVSGSVCDFFNEELDFGEHVFDKCVFKSMDLRKWHLRSASFYSCYFEDCLFSKDLERITVNNCQFKNMDFSGSHVENLSFYGCKFEDVSFASSEISSCNFSECILERCSFEKIRQDCKNVFQKCSFTGINFSKSSIPRIHLLDCAEFVDVDFSGSELTSAVLSGISAGGETKVRFDNAVLATTNFEKSHFFENAFQNTVLDRTVFSGSDFNKMEFKGQNLSKVWFDGCNIKDCLFEGCNMYGAKMNEATLSNVRFLKIDGTGIFAQKSVMKGCDFLQSNLDYMDLSYAQLMGCNFRNCSMNGMTRHDFKGEKSFFESCSLKNVLDKDQDLYDAEHFY